MRRWRVPAVLLGVVIVGGIVWSNLLGYHDVQLTPHARFAELDRIGHEIRGQGPTLMNDFEPYGNRLFLRRADPEGASDLRRRLVRLRTGGEVPRGQAADIDAFQLPAVLAYRMLVLRRSPFASRPPSVYRLVRSGRFYDVWQRRPGTVIEHEPLPDAPAPCAQVMRIARSGERVAFAAAPPAAPQLPMSARGFTVAAPGRYELWIGGAFRGRVEVRVDGKRVAVRDDELAYAAPFVSFGRLDLPAGLHRLEVRHTTNALQPGSGSGGGFRLRSVVIAPVRDIDRLQTLPASRASDLCGKRLDWVEALP
jgi:hypothetical protein